MPTRERLKAAVRSIVMAYARSFVALLGAAYVGALDPARKLDAVWSLVVAVAWSALPASLRALEAVLATTPRPQPVWLRVTLSFGRAMVTTALMAVAGPIHGAREALHAIIIAAVPALLRAVQEAMDATAPAAALARRGRQVIDTTATGPAYDGPLLDATCP